MAAAGTLSRPTSAQGSYSLSQYHTYYSPPSPTIAGSYSRPASAGANYSSESYSPFRKPVPTTRPVVSRLATSSQYIPSTSPDAPTRIYGTRAAVHSADDLSSTTLQKFTPVQLQRNYTAPDLRPMIRDPNRQSNKLQALDVNSSLRMTIPETRERVSTEFKSDRPVTASPARSTAHAKRNSRSAPLEDVGIEQVPRVVQATEETDEITSLGRQSPSTSTNLTQGALSELPKKHTSHQSTDSRKTADGGERNKESGTADVLQSQILNSKQTDNQIPSNAALVTHQSTSQPSEDPIGRQDRYEDAPSVHLPPRSQTPVPMNYLSPEKSKSLKNRLRRALSLGSSSRLSELGMDEQTRAQKYSAVQDQRSGPIYGQRNKSTDNVSVASNASSASMMLRKLSHGLTKKTKRSINNLFSGSRSNYQAASGIPEESVRPRVDPVVGHVNYVNAEPHPSDRPQSPQREIFSRHTRAQGSISSVRAPAVPAKVEITQAASNVDGHGSVAFPRLSEEMVVDEDRSKRASMHLERPLPIDLAERTVEPVSEDTTTALSSFGMGRPDHIGSVSKGILKRPQGSLPQSPQSDSRDDSPPAAGQADHGFDFSFDPIPEIAKFSVSVDEATPPSTTPTAQTTPTTYIAPPIPASKSGGPLKFSPRITIHDTYTANEYDRRGELATCNRLTPLLAQRIKEELNAYKMDEMQVAEESKMYTHFFS